MERHAAGWMLTNSNVATTNSQRQLFFENNLPRTSSHSRHNVMVVTRWDIINQIVQTKINGQRQQTQQTQRQQQTNKDTKANNQKHVLPLLLLILLHHNWSDKQGRVYHILTLCCLALLPLCTHLSSLTVSCCVFMIMCSTH